MERFRVERLAQEHFPALQAAVEECEKKPGKVDATAARRILNEARIAFESPRNAYFVAVKDGEVIGITGATHTAPGLAQDGITLVFKHRRKGVGTALAEKKFGHLLGPSIGVKEISGVANKDSKAILRKMAEKFELEYTETPYTPEFDKFELKTKDRQ